jgi:SAM domain (Sterile alpha motif)
MMSISATEKITECLAKIGLERYVPTFAENDIDVSVLRHLTDADLEKNRRIGRPAIKFWRR